MKLISSKEKVSKGVAKKLAMERVKAKKNKTRQAPNKTSFGTKQAPNKCLFITGSYGYRILHYDWSSFGSVEPDYQYIRVMQVTDQMVKIQLCMAKGKPSLSDAKACFNDEYCHTMQYFVKRRADDEGEYVRLTNAVWRPIVYAKEAALLLT